MSQYRDPYINAPFGITAGPDGALWFTDGGGNRIGRITTSGQVTIYATPGLSSPSVITPGPDGTLWFTNNGGASIGKITLRGNSLVSVSL